MEITKRDWLDEKDQEGGWTPLICVKCNNDFHGWKFKTKCFVCAVPEFPKHMRHITQVAVRFAGEVYNLPAPRRHHHVLCNIYKAHGKSWPNVQGFLDNKGKFLLRRDAMRVALAAGQVLDPLNIHSGQLYSEDLW